MGFIALENTSEMKKTIMIFAEGTVLRPKTIFSLYNHNSYIPIGNCVEIIKEWHGKGVNIVYCTSRKGKRAQNIAVILKRYGFSGSRLYYRSKGEKYKDIVEKVKPDVLIEDDCKSIGGAWQMCITKVTPQIKENIVSIVVEEFKGIDELPRKIEKVLEVG